MFQSRAGQFSRLFREAPLKYARDTSMLNLVPGDIISGCIAFTGLYEWHLTQKIVELVHGGATRFIDVGANMGYFSVLWASLNPLAKVTSFEPVTRNVELLTGNRDGNQLGERIEIIGKAVSDFTGHLKFDSGPSEQTGWGGISSSGSLSVPCLRLDEIIGDETVDLMKVDVEGAEALVFKGADRLLRNGIIRRIVFEYNSERAADHKEGNALSIVESFGYKCHRLGSSDGMWLADRTE